MEFSWYLGFSIWLHVLYPPSLTFAPVLLFLKPHTIYLFIEWMVFHCAYVLLGICLRGTILVVTWIPSACDKGIHQLIYNMICHNFLGALTWIFCWLLWMLFYVTSHPLLYWTDLTIDLKVNKRSLQHVIKVYTS